MTGRHKGPRCRSFWHLHREPTHLVDCEMVSQRDYALAAR